ncbi:hypothetical protein BJY16_004303 [Actinoplanes octamycinicus]|uniref:DUF4265 domain-containing protein n=1 Tax=Actinoplanes octamycinicus TaxID=135948 RepID=A0A7W7GYT8_9ACTN|nr:DUF4265 domain-containing protein [Actinoplanes octamycinicus]MBB4740844.1 hypothetical protein [Actinoplanes octamycinicus]
MTVEELAGHSHVRLVAGLGAGGQLVYETVLTRTIEPDLHLVLGTPAFVEGIAAGDRIRLRAGGGFEVVERGGNICLLVVPGDPPGPDDLAPLRDSFDDLGGIVELPPDRRFIVITVPAAAGFDAVEAAIDEWTGPRGFHWEYGNVYDSDGKPLNWWD